MILPVQWPKVNFVNSLCEGGHRHCAVRSTVRAIGDLIELRINAWGVTIERQSLAI